jgi:hypothetical protein
MLCVNVPLVFPVGLYTDSRVISNIGKWFWWGFYRPKKCNFMVKKCSTLIFT